MKTVCLAIESEFAVLHRSSVGMISALSPELLYKSPSPETGSAAIPSTGEAILKSAGIVEQTFGGLTTNLWDDPFEWTLPETLVTPSDVGAYLAEVEATRQRGFAVINSDAELTREVAVPGGNTVPLIRVLVHALAEAWHHQGQAFFAFKMLSDAKLSEIDSLREPFVCDNR